MSPTPTAQRYPMAPLIRFTLLAPYLALVLPLPVLAPEALQRPLLLAAIAGLLLVVAITSERVELDERELRVGHPPGAPGCCAAAGSCPGIASPPSPR